MIATALAVAFVVISCKEKLDVAQALDLDNTPMQIVDDMFIVHTENGILQMRVEAPLMERYKKDTVEYELFPKGLAVYAYTDEGLLETQILSDNAKHQKFSDGRETWAAFGNVVVKNLIEQQTMETDTLYWNQQDEKLYTDCYVKMYSPDGFMQGYGMESDQKASTAYILKPFNNYAVIIQDSTQVVIDSANFIGPLQKN
jgi:LPS export ABC transporter protein LptC